MDHMEGIRGDEDVNVPVYLFIVEKNVEEESRSCFGSLFFINSSFL